MRKHRYINYVLLWSWNAAFRKGFYAWKSYAQLQHKTREKEVSEICSNTIAIYSRLVQVVEEKKVTSLATHWLVTIHTMKGRATLHRHYFNLAYERFHKMKAAIKEEAAS